MSGTYPDTLHDVGLVFVTYAVVVIVATLRPEPRVVGAVFAPLRIWGQLALSLYLLHVGIVSLWARAAGYPTENNPIGWASVVVLPLIIAWLWGRFVGTGPVEWLMGAVSGRPKPLLRPRGASVRVPTTG